MTAHANAELERIAGSNLGRKLINTSLPSVSGGRVAFAALLTHEEDDNHLVDCFTRN